MQTVTERVSALLREGKRVLGWKRGESFYDASPAVLHGTDAANDCTYDAFCASNLSKYVIEKAKDERLVVLLKPCDTYGFRRLVTEGRINRDNVYAIGVPCAGMLDIEKLRGMGFNGMTAVDVDGDTVTVHTLYGDRTCSRVDALCDKCRHCKGEASDVYDEVIDGERMAFASDGRFDRVVEIEAMGADERFAFWRAQLSKCIRCNACRNICPACTCNSCVFDNRDSQIAGKSNADAFEENLFHIIRAYHVAGRCTDCGECARVCPQHIPLDLLNRKLIKDVNAFYGAYQSGASDQPAPLTQYDLDDIEPNDAVTKGGAS